MNVLDLSDLLNELPDDMIISAYQRQFSPHAVEEPVSFDRTVTEKRAEASVKHPPRWMTAVALAACMLFAVGVGALLLRGQHENLTTQSSQADSSEAEIVTAVRTETTAPVTTVPEPADISGTQTTAAQSQTTAEETVTVYPTAETIPEETTGQIKETAPPETTALPVTTAAETSAQTTATDAPHPVMQMTSVEEVEREGLRMAGEYKRRLAQLRGELAADAPRITLDEVMQMTGSGMDYRSVSTRLAELYPYPDYDGGSGISMTQYWLDDSGNDYILLIHEQQDIVHVIRNRADNLYEKLLSEEGSS